MLIKRGGGIQRSCIPPQHLIASLDTNTRTLRTALLSLRCVLWGARWAYQVLLAQRRRVARGNCYESRWVAAPPC